MKRIFVLTIIGLLIFSCKENDKMQFVKKLNGKWASAENEGSRFFEDWIISDSKLMVGKAFLLSDGIDTTISEELKIELKDNEIFYVAKVKNENDNKPIKFLLIENESTHLIFENKLHDFPQRIKYFFMGDREIKVVVEGEYEGKQESNEMLLEKW
jgi:hypothetical protein